MEMGIIYLADEAGIKENRRLFVGDQTVQENWLDDTRSS